MDWLWVFHGCGGTLSSAIFSDKLKAESWISQYSLSGILTKMPVDKSIYNWAIETEMFIPKKDYQKGSKFIQQFISAYLEHFHYKDGEIS